MKQRLWVLQPNRLALGLVAVLGLTACSISNVSVAAPEPSASPVVTPTVMMTAGTSQPAPDVLIRPAQSGQVISVSVGQVIGVSLPSMAMKWQVSYAFEILEMLTPPEEVQAPGPAGWLFRAIAPGKTDLLLTSIVEACSDNTPCPPMPARLVFTIDVK